MQRILIFLLLIFQSSLSTAQRGGFQLGLNGGVGLAHFKGGDVMGGATGTSFPIEFKMIGGTKHLEFSTGVDLVVVSTDAYLYTTKPQTNYGRSIRLSEPATRFGPFGMVNYKMHLSGKSYLYAGGYIGLGTATWRGHQIFAGITGAQVGYVFAIFKRLDLEIAENWRYMKLNDVYYEDGSYQLVMYYAPVGINYFNTTVGIRLRFKK